jgi:hypothetical protein
MFNCLSQKITLTSLTTIDLGYLGESKKTKNRKQKTEQEKTSDQNILQNRHLNTSVLQTRFRKIKKSTQDLS